LKSTVSDRVYDDTQAIRLDVSWETYSNLVTNLGDTNHVRLAYDGKTLEIMAPGLRHEQISRLIAALLIYAFDEWEIDYEEAGTTTFKTKPSGFEGDATFYLANADKVRAIEEIDLSSYPAPDLVLEVDITSERTNKQTIYEEFGIGEFWRYDEKNGLEAFALNNGGYVKIEVSQAIRGLPLSTIGTFIEQYKAGVKRPAIISAAKAWLRDNRHLHE
jgi:Uma2 family endonuclease